MNPRPRGPNSPALQHIETITTTASGKENSGSWSRFWHSPCYNLGEFHLFSAKGNHSMSNQLLQSMAALILGVTSAHASTIITHSGNADPATQGWQPWSSLSGAEWDHTFFADAGPVTTDGVDAWRILDTTVGPRTGGSDELPYRYNTRPLVGQNWRFTALVKAYQRSSAENSRLNATMDVNAQTQFNPPTGYRHRLTLYDNGQGGTEVYVFGSSPYVTTIDNTGFNWVEMIHTTGQGTSLFINGSEVVNNLPAVGISTSYGTVRWGDTIFVAGGQGGADWAFVEFEHDPSKVMTPIGIPEPSALALLGISGLLVANRRRGE
jgi:hypothetical protein